MPSPVLSNQSYNPHRFESPINNFLQRPNSLSTIEETISRCSDHSSIGKLSGRVSLAPIKNDNSEILTSEFLFSYVSDAVDKVQALVLKTAIINSRKKEKPRRLSDLNISISGITKDEANQIWRENSDGDSFHAVSDFIWDAGIDFWENRVRKIDFTKKGELEKCILSAFIDQYGKELTLENLLKNPLNLSVTSSHRIDLEVIDETEHQILRRAIINSLYYSKIDLNNYKINDLENITDEEVDFIWRDFSKSNYRCITREFVENLSDASLDKLMQRTRFLKDPQKVKTRLIENLTDSLINRYGANLTLEDLIYRPLNKRKSQSPKLDLLCFSD